MPCTNPIIAFYPIKPDKNGNHKIMFTKKEGIEKIPLKIPCGNCISCRLYRAHEWAMRCVLEASLYKHNSFVTLTYSPENLPENGTLVKKHVQQFLKNLRQIYAPQIIRFYLSGEYGEKLGRPHYHVLLFNLEFEDKEYLRTENGNKYYRSKTLERAWKKGFSDISEVTYNSAKYVAKYIMKKQNGEAGKTHYQIIDQETGEITGHLLPEFSQQSLKPGIGKDWFMKNYTWVTREDEIRIEGKSRKIPKYFLRVLRKLEPEKYDEILKTRRRNRAEIEPEYACLNREIIENEMRKT